MRKIYFSRISILLAFIGCSHSASIYACDSFTYEFRGLERTDESWLRDYLELISFHPVNDEDLTALRQKIMTTDIFSGVDVSIEKTSEKKCNVTISVDEKRTGIPVLRGAFGGGTPLVILGGYQTNAFGKLLAIGGELRRYGDMAPGAFFFFKSPRAWRGRGLWGGEIWLDRRRRGFFDVAGKLYGYADSEAWTAKYQWLYPLESSSSGVLQGGFQAQASRESPTTFHEEKNYGSTKKLPPQDLRLNSNAGVGGIVGPMFVFDGLALDGLLIEGMKAKAAFGEAKGAETSGGFAETELYSYLRLPGDINFASRIFAGTTSQNTVGSVYYLGGFDSVRGLPDGVHYGNKAVFGNFETRIIAAKFKYAHIQPALFYDAGSAWMDSQNPNDGRETSIGGGVRIAIPQIYRFVVRIDYGISIGHTKSKGFSIGLNQFFQPYKLTF